MYKKSGLTSVSRTAGKKTNDYNLQRFMVRKMSKIQYLIIFSSWNKSLFKFHLFIRVNKNRNFHKYPQSTNYVSW